MPPLYDFVCKACGAEYEANREIDQPSEEECPYCHDGKASKIHKKAPPAILRGSFPGKDMKRGGNGNL